MPLRSALLCALTGVAATSPVFAANLVVNPNFDTGISHWAGAPGTFFFDATQGSPAAGSARLVATAAGTPGYAISDCIVVDASSHVDIGANIQLNAGDSAQVSVAVFTDTACATQITASAPDPMYVTAEQAGTWLSRSSPDQALPAGTHSVRMLLLVFSATGSASANFDTIEFSPRPPPVTRGPVCRVTITGSNTANGASWAQAVDLQTALRAGDCTELWVAQGTYLPVVAASPAYEDRATSFVVRPGVAVYGGFAGTEALRSQRNDAANPTVLSGNIGSAGNNADNSFNVVRMDGTGANPITASTVLDGFTVRDGFANSDVNTGAGLYCNGGGAGHACSPTLSRLHFTGNFSTYRGGAIYNDGSNGGDASPTLSNITFSDNVANSAGGAIYDDGAFGGRSSPVLGNVTFSGNRTGNTGYGAGMYNDGSDGGTSSPRLVNVTFSGNVASSYGGAMFNDAGFGQTLGTSAPVLINVIAWGDTASVEAEIENYQATPTISYSMIAGGCPLGSQCTNLVSGDPKLGVLANNGGGTPTMLPASDSIALDSGHDADCAAAPVSGVDQRGIARPQGSQCDIGAVEVPGGRVVVVIGPICRVSTTGTAAANGNDWPQAMTLQAALGTATCTELWVAKGTYLPTLAASPLYGDRAISFAVHPGVAVYGGFAGNETQRSQRDFVANPTTLSGDIGGAGNAADNSFNVVTMDGTTGAGPITASTVLDGFTVSNGFANTDRNSGAGLYCNGSGSGHECSPTLSHLTFKDNTSSRIGGALVNDGGNGGKSSPLITSVTFSGNVANQDGGAMYNQASGNGISSPVLGNVTFSGNRTGNDGWGGALYNNGTSSGVSSPKLVNVTFYGNQAGQFGYGGAMASNGGFSTTAGTSRPTLVNVIAWNDTARTDPEISSYQSTTDIGYSIIQGGCPFGSLCNHVDLRNPLLGPPADNGGGMQTLLPLSGSPATDAGSDADCSLAPVNGLDQRGVTRPQGPHCDIGAVEAPPDRIFRNGFEPN